MLNYNELKDRYLSVKDIVLKYRHEFTTAQGLLGETLNVIDVNSYSKFMNELSETEFVMNMAGCITNDIWYGWLEDLKNGEKTIDYCINVILMSDEKLKEKYEAIV